MVRAGNNYHKAETNMKKILIILALVFMIIGTAAAQTATVNVADRYTYYNLATDYTLTNTTVSWFKWKYAKDYPSTQDFQVEFSWASGTQTRVDIVLYGRKFSDDSWTSIGTGNWQHGVNDSIVTISNTSINRYREFKTEFTGTGTGTSTIEFQALKLWKQ